ncbi:hypothetical protein ESCO_006322 [Escovopsis weberi]|uniref:Uncharacterized protein n=1 Tax=Escovopsis weberi TaxID=150374 RepID=A0A0N0RTL0_ESCWE|nr:hypothetical protein ESCO_006322 [Escovopsis weberi]
MHQKNNQAAQASSTTVLETHDERGAANENMHETDLADPFGDVEEEEELDDLDEEDMAGQFGRGSWWREVVHRQAEGGEMNDDDHDDDDDDGGEEEFGDFAMAETDKAAADDKDSLEGEKDKVLLKPLAVHPSGGSGRGLIGLWPFGSRSDKEKSEEPKEDRKSDLVVPILKRDAAATEMKAGGEETGAEDGAAEVDTDKKTKE